MKHNSITPLRFIPPIRRTLSAISIVLSLAFAVAAFAVQQGTSFTYQGQLRRSGAAYNGTCNFQFSLWNAASAGTQKANTQSINGVSVVNGLFTVVLDFGGQFYGESRWLGTTVQCSGDGGFTPLVPRQPITASPYALSLRPGATIISEAGRTLSLIHSGPEPFESALEALNDGPGNAIYAYASGAGTGVVGNSENGIGVFGRIFETGTAIHGEILGTTGFAGRFFGPVDVKGQLTVNGGGTGGNAITGTGPTGVSGKTNISNGIGVYGAAVEANSAGVFGVNSSGAGVWGKSEGAGSAVYGQATSTGWAGRFTGSVLVEGNMIVTGTLQKNTGSFRIDHPLDPANKFLSHSFVESPDMMNVYNGNVTTDATGSATITLPDYFASLNRDFRYQLTALGQFAQAMVSRKIAGNSFEIRTDKPGVEVSWQVTGIRQDAYAQAKPIVVEEFKPAEEKGLYLYPAGFGAGEDKRIGHSSRPATAPGAQDPAGAGQSSQPSK